MKPAGKHCDPVLHKKCGNFTAVQIIIDMDPPLRKYLIGSIRNVLRQHCGRTFCVFYLNKKVITALLFQILFCHLPNELPVLDDPVLGGYFAQFPQDMGADEDGLSFFLI